MANPLGQNLPVDQTAAPPSVNIAGTVYQITNDNYLDLAHKQFQYLKDSGHAVSGQDMTAIENNFRVRAGQAPLTYDYPAEVSVTAETLKALPQATADTAAEYASQGADLVKNAVTAVPDILGNLQTDFKFLIIGVVAIALIYGTHEFRGLIPKGK